MSSAARSFRMIDKSDYTPKHLGQKERELESRRRIRLAEEYSKTRENNESEDYTR